MLGALGSALGIISKAAAASARRFLYWIFRRIIIRFIHVLVMAALTTFAASFRRALPVTGEIAAATMGLIFMRAAVLTAPAARASARRHALAFRRTALPLRRALFTLA
jgi:heme/copper-type cytochrome/quinol oxidase subunit 2